MNKVELPPVYNTGSPAALISVLKPKFYKKDAVNPLESLPNHQCPNCGLVIEQVNENDEVVIDENTQIVAFYEDKENNTNHICGEKEIRNPLDNYWNGAGHNFAAFSGKENIPDEEDILKGAQYGDQVHLGIVYNDAIYRITPRYISALQGDGSWEKVDMLKSMPMQMYALGDLSLEERVSEFDIDLSEEIELLPCHYLIWLEDQCPVFAEPLIVRDFQANKIRSGIKSSPTIGKVKYYSLYNISSMKLHGGRVKYDNGKYFEKDEADGQMSVGKYGTYYRFTQSDRDRGYITFKYYAKRNSGCGMKSDPFMEIRYNLLLLDESALPPDEQLEPPTYVPPVKPPPAELEYKEVDFTFDENIYESEGGYVKAVSKDGKLALINHTEKLLTFDIFKPGVKKRVWGGGVRPEKGRVTGISTKGSQKTYTLNWRISKFNLEDEVELTFD